MADLSAGSGLSRFAHLTGGIAAKAKAEDDEKDKKEAAGEDEDEDDEKDKKDPGDEEGDDAKDAEDDNDDNDDNDEKPARTKGKVKSKASASAVAFDEGYRAGFQAAQARGDAILSHATAAANPALAAQMATGNSLPVKEAVAIMKAASAAPVRYSSGLNARMASVPPIHVGADAPGADQPQTKAEEARALASSIIASARASGVIRK